MIKYIESAISEKLKTLTDISIIYSPYINFEIVRQNKILNIQYVGENFIYPTERKLNISNNSKNRLSDINFKINLYIKDLRNNYNEVYEYLDKIIYLLNGEVLKIDSNNINNVSPIYVSTINFIEKNTQMFIHYEINLLIRAFINYL